ncbi:hypothetical protein AAZX31_09G109800 [Glycine max]|uniref:SMP-30/Gluconolactonase/LRE-like region domain-containing protein n=2 Tax=Glycine subgen. Soja TaxID=1462606 RepID=I1L2T0_SOYBN|nr:uncharacterized protein LOC100793489 [Glycine max]XP_028181664.1 uncharacterized protein LOC114368648 [Glycine soja]KAG4991303.1 hypothetical protein JHK87_024760 [Glycine soja]KAG5006889.1 hypothetical protein JHK85_025431 [Glycine max]KAG5012674.1 hypothetical protein JHK86_024935 [Glycine max]KAG5133634.1 hypothetical protein JHK82_024822 [Glycine max]KAH1042636.1 hypothetical protein GYH30_024774 [Glycine max]|eukprot:XP_003533944.1 uncharacterized protein LOC100793489 [Glycine max]
MPTLSSKPPFTNYPVGAAAATTLLFLFFAVGISTVLASNHHVINFRSPNLFPEGLAWDPTAQHFLVGSLRHRTISAVSDAGVVETLISDPSLPENVTFLGLAVDSRNNRVLVAIHATEPLPPFNALAAYDLRSRRRLFLSPLPSAAGDDKRATANDVAADFNGNAYVTNSVGNYIWKVNLNGEASILSNSPKFTVHPVVRDTVYSFCGLNGIVYNNKGYLLVVQSNTGKMFKIDKDDGTVRQVLLNEDLMGADGVALRGDGVVLVVSFSKLWFVKSNDGWAQGAVFDKIDLDEEGFPTSVVVGERDRAYVLHGRVMEGILGNSERESFMIEEVKSPKESEGENVWLYVMVGIGLAYFLFWRFQMKQLVKNMDKKIN